VVESRVGNLTLLGPINDDSVQTQHATSCSTPFGGCSLVVRNGDTAPIPAGSLTVTSRNPAVQFPNVTRWPVPALTGGDRTTLSIPVQLGAFNTVSSSTFEVSTLNPSLGPDPVTSAVTVGLNYASRVRPRADACANAPPTRWWGPRGPQGVASNWSGRAAT
jgi:hypothetical protein